MANSVLYSHLQPLELGRLYSQLISFIIGHVALFFTQQLWFRILNESMHSLYAQAGHHVCTKIVMWPKTLFNPLWTRHSFHVEVEMMLKFVVIFVALAVSCHGKLDSEAYLHVRYFSWSFQLRVLNPMWNPLRIPLRTTTFPLRVSSLHKWRSTVVERWDNIAIRMGVWWGFIQRGSWNPPLPPQPQFSLPEYL